MLPAVGSVPSTDGNRNGGQFDTLLDFRFFVRPILYSKLFYRKIKTGVTTVGAHHGWVEGYMRSIRNIENENEMFR